jgi:arsenite/tail-anchored protein-transporting ATPase
VSSVVEILTRFAFYGGKGGVGKTTCAAARAVAEAGRGARVLVVSTDPAHSLGDALAVRLHAAPSRVRLHRARRRPSASGSLDAVEIDARRAFARWIREHRHALGEALEHGTWLDRSDIDALLDLPIPGINELVGLIEIRRLAGGLRDRARYDLVIVDTAPTGHTLRLLAAPQAVRAMAAVLDALQQDHRYIRRQLAGAAGPDAADRLIDLMTTQADEAAAALRDAARTAFHWVTLPEALAIAESRDAIAALSAAGLQVGEVVVNRVLADAGRCRLCGARRADERRALAAIRAGIGKRRIVRVVPAELDEPRGIEALAAIGRRLVAAAGKSFDSLTPSSSSIADARDDREPLEGSKGALARRFEGLHRSFRGADLIFVGGKGGVGKTTVAAAIALRIARASPDRRVLLLSTDPAHSLADVFSAPVDDDPAPPAGAPPNLHARELDATRALDRHRAALVDALDDVAESAGVGASLAGAASPSGAAAELMGLAPPGIDELFGLIEIAGLVRARAHRGYDVIVVDTAPTGHTLRLLAVPDEARRWLQVLLRLLLKYRALARPGRLAAELVEVSQSIRELQARLRDPVRTRFVVITRAAGVPRAETVRLLNHLRRLSLAVPAVVVNARTLSPGSCRRCRIAADAERRELSALRAAIGARGGCAIIQTPLVAPAPRGAASLEQWGRTWIA